MKNYKNKIMTGALLLCKMKKKTKRKITETLEEGPTPSLYRTLHRPLFVGLISFCYNLLGLTIYLSRTHFRFCSLS